MVQHPVLDGRLRFRRKRRHRAPGCSAGELSATSIEGQWNEEFQPASGTLFSYIMNNYWDTNYRAGQGGDFVFRYAMTSAAKLDGGSLTHLAMEEMRPPELDYVVSQDKAGNPPRPLPAAGQGFLETDGSGISLITWKRAEDGNGTILRLAETTGQANSGGPFVSLIHESSRQTSRQGSKMTSKSYRPKAMQSTCHSSRSRS